MALPAKKIVPAEPLPIAPPLPLAERQQHDFNRAVVDYLRRLPTSIRETIIDTGGGGAAESEVPNIDIYTPTGISFNGAGSDGYEGIFVSPDYTWNTNKYTKLMNADSDVDDILVFHKSSTDVAVSGSAGAWIITIPNNHIILDQNQGDFSGLSAAVVLQTADLTKKRTIPVSPTKNTGWLDDAPTLPDVGTFNVLAGWATGIPSTQLINKSSFTSAGLIDSDGWARFKITHITIGTGYCRFRCYGSR